LRPAVWSSRAKCVRSFYLLLMLKEKEIFHYKYEHEYEGELTGP